MDHAQPYNHHQPYHLVEIVPDSLLAQIVGKDSLPVNSTHHQLLAKLGTNLRVVASAPDGVVEAVEMTGNDQLLAVQWHPEYLVENQPAQLAILRWIITQATAYQVKGQN